MKSPFETTWAFPKFYGGDAVRVEESPQLTENYCRVKLKRVGFIVKNFLCSMNGIGYDDDLQDDIVGTSLVDTTSDCKQFCFSACHERRMVNCFGERTILSRSSTVDFILFYFIFIFSFFPFSIFRTARVRVDWSRCHISHKLMAKSQD